MITYILIGTVILISVIMIVLMVKMNKINRKKGKNVGQPENET